jgi:hypothetical protein
VGTAAYRSSIRVHVPNMYAHAVLPLLVRVTVMPSIHLHFHSRHSDHRVLTLLTSLSSPARYNDNVIYTYVGDILVAVNPFRVVSGL